jgi:putative addiction module killer protein
LELTIRFDWLIWNLLAISIICVTIDRARRTRVSRRRRPVKRWFDQLDANASAKVTFAITRISQGNLSNAKSVGGGVFEFKIDFGPGYRLYFGRDGERIVILLGGGTKKRQQRDIEIAIANWREYKRRK